MLNSNRVHFSHFSHTCCLVGWFCFLIGAAPGNSHSPSLPLRPYFTPIKGIPGSQDSDEAHFLGLQTPHPPSSPTLSVSLLQPSVFCPLVCPCSFLHSLVTCYSLHLRTLHWKWSGGLRRGSGPHSSQRDTSSQREGEAWKRTWLPSSTDFCRTLRGFSVSEYPAQCPSLQKVYLLHWPYMDVSL